MNKRTPFDPTHLSFAGTPLEQARSLLRFVKRGGDVEDGSIKLPNVLESLLSAPQQLELTVSQLRAYLQLHAISENSAGGSLDNPVSRADTNNPSARLAQYFLIHDTSSKLDPGETFDPNFINTTKWSGNRLSNLAGGKTHLYINRLGDVLMDNDYHTPFRATQFELQPKASIPSAPQNGTVLRGLCLHHELIQPRIGPGKSDIESPNPGFTQAQYERLALQYLIASVRRGSWMIPAFHGVIDLGIGDHDDPQRFDLPAWGNALESILAAVRNPGGTGNGDATPPPPPPVQLRSQLLKGHPELAKVAAGDLVLMPNQTRDESGVGALQDALNLLADLGDSNLNIPGARPGAGSRGFYGKQTTAAVMRFQSSNHVTPVDGNTGRDTIRALDQALLATEQASPENVAVTASDATGGTPVGNVKTPASSARTKDGEGGSTTSGLEGQIFEQDGAEFTDASETLTAFRDSHSLGAARTVRQTRTKRNGVTTVHQPDYCWGKRLLPDAELIDDHPGLDDEGGVFAGKATFFGKSDQQDEGTGTGAYGTVQTNSSVCGISLKRQRLLDEGLATEDCHKVLHPTDKGLRALVEVFFPETKRGARLPLVDVGPGESGAAKTAVADLTVAATVFLQKLTEDELTKPHQGKIDNIQVRLRILA